MKNSIKKAAKATLDFVKNHKVLCGTVVATLGIATAGCIYLGKKGFKQCSDWRDEGLGEIYGNKEDIQVDIEENEIKDLKEEEKKTEEEE